VTIAPAPADERPRDSVPDPVAAFFARQVEDKRAVDVVLERPEAP